MTKVKMIYDNNIVLGFRMEGHAGYNPGGPDILCASLSTASQITVNGILDWIGLDYDEIVTEFDKKAGVMEVRLPSKLYGSTTVQQLFKSFELYVEMLEGQYGEHVSLERSYNEKTIQEDEASDL